MEASYQHLIDLNDYPVSWWNQIVALGADIKEHPQRYTHACVGKVMAGYLVLRALHPNPDVLPGCHDPAGRQHHRL